MPDQEPDPLNVEAERLRTLMHERGFRTVAALASAMQIHRARIDLALKGGSESAQQQVAAFLDQPGSAPAPPTPPATSPAPRAAQQNAPRVPPVADSADESDLVAAYRDFRSAQEAAKQALARIRAILGVPLEVAA